MKRLLNVCLFNAYLTCMIVFVFYIRTAWDHIGCNTTLLKARHKLATKIFGIFYGNRVGKHIELI